MAENGARWIKVIARNPKALDLNSCGGNQFGQKSFMDQVSEFLDCARQNVKLFRVPTVVFVFHNGVSQRLANKIGKKGAVVEGEVIQAGGGEDDGTIRDSGSEEECDEEDSDAFQEEEEEQKCDLQLEMKPEWNCLHQGREELSGTGGIKECFSNKMSFQDPKRTYNNAHTQHKILA